MKTVDLDKWPRAAQYPFFRSFAQPHYAITSRMDVTRLVARKAEVSPYRACLYAIGAGLHHVPELRMRFRGDTVVLHESIALSMTVPNTSGSFNYAYVPYDPDFDAFEQQASALIEAVAQTTEFGAHVGETDALAYLSCLPWLDFTSMNNALPGPDDCIPRISWGKFVAEGGRVRMAMALEVHHALVDGQQVGDYFAKVQNVLDAF